jgi:hypothetical protein
MLLRLGGFFDIKSFVFGLRMKLRAGFLETLNLLALIT